MKKVFVLVALLAMGFAATAQEVTIKRGKATMSEADYNVLKQKADAYEAAQKTLNETTAKYQKLQAESAANSPQELRTFTDSASYAIGRDIFTSWNQQNLGINAKAAAQAMMDCASGRNKWTDAMTRPLLNRFQQNFEQRQREEQQKMMAGLQDNIAAGKKYLEEVSLNKSVYTTKSGLKYKKNKEGNGKRPTANNTVKVHYTGKLIDGTVFDSSVERGEPIEFPLTQVIAGWTEGLQLMDEGSSYTLYIPYNLAYGEQPVGSIPPGSTLVFDVELIQIVK